VTSKLKISKKPAVWYFEMQNRWWFSLGNPGFFYQPCKKGTSPGKSLNQNQKHFCVRVYFILEVVCSLWLKVLSFLEGGGLYLGSEIEPQGKTRQLT